MVELDWRRILLVHPLGYNADRAGSDISRIANIMPPLGLASIAAYLDQKKIQTDIIDCFALPDSGKKILEHLKKYSPGYIGFSCTTSSFIDALRIAKMAKEESPGIKSVFGGPHVSALGKKILETETICDYLVIGEGEEVLENLINLKSKNLHNIEGLVYRDSQGKVRFNGYRNQRLKLDDLPFPAYEKLEGFPSTYQLPIFNYPKTPNVSCISSRGCPYSCSYCDRSVFRKSFRYNSADYLYRHMKYLKDKFKIRHVNFYDDLFTFNRGRVEDFCLKMIENPLKMTFNCAVRAEHIDLKLLKKMKAAGCWMISLGIESGDKDLLVQHRQKADLDLLAAKIREIKKARIRVKGLLMMGLPGETEETIKNSMEYVFSLPIDDFNLSKFTPFPGSPIYEKIHELGEFDEDPAKMDCMHFVFVPKGMDRKRLEELFILFYKSHFKRMRIIWDYVTMLWRSPNSWWRFLCNLKIFLRFASSNVRIKDPEKT